MTVFLGIGAVRIQTWLSQTPKLTHLRGASAALRARTDNDAIRDWLAGCPDLAGVELVTDAGNIDGVVAVSVPATSRPEVVAQRLVLRLHELLPGVGWAAWWSEADTYLEAHYRAHRNGATPANDSSAQAVQGGRLTTLIPIQDNGLVKSCLLCRREPGLVSAGTPDRGPLDDDETRALDTQGHDCATRDAAQRDKAADIWSRGPMAVPGRPAKDFEELARHGGLPPAGTAAKAALGRRESRNHLATIAADGNGIGGLVQAMMPADGAPGRLVLDSLYRDMVGRLDDAIHNAVRTAARSVGDSMPEVRVMAAHYVGGDDCLVSVPAAYAWRFATQLAETFGELGPQLAALLDDDLRRMEQRGPLTDAAKESAERVRERIQRISLGVGMTFAHSSQPFAETNALAHRALAAAKRAGSGKDPVIGWVDMTAESDAAFGARAAIPTIAVSHARQQLDQPATRSDEHVFRLKPSARSQLATLLRDEGSEASDEVKRWAKRRGEQFWSAPRANSQPWEERMATLPAALSRARWWPNVADEETGS